LVRRLIEEGDHVLVYLDRRRRWLVRVTKGAKLHTHEGVVDIGGTLGQPFGIRVDSTLGATFYALKPISIDFLMKAERRTQVVYPKDLGLIAVKTGVSPGATVVEVGTGSGVLTGFLANLVRPDGHVYSYEARPEFLAVARRNLEKLGLADYVTLVGRDAKEGLEPRDADAGIIDVGDPWLLVKPISAALVAGAVVAAISPTMNQVEKLVVELSEEGYVDVESLEVIVRGLEARPGMTRPAMRMIGHTAYLTFARKTASAKE